MYKKEGQAWTSQLWEAQVGRQSRAHKQPIYPTKHLRLWEQAKFSRGLEEGNMLLA